MYTTKILDGYRIQIPKEIIKQFNLKVGDKIIWKTNGEKIILRFEKNKY